MKNWILVVSLALFSSSGWSKTPTDPAYQNLVDEISRNYKLLEKSKKELESMEKDVRKIIAKNTDRIDFKDGSYIVKDDRVNQELAALQQRAKDQRKAVEALQTRYNALTAERLERLSQKAGLTPKPDLGSDTPPTSDLVQFLNHDHALTTKLDELQKLGLSNEALAQEVQRRYQNTVLDAYLQQKLEAHEKQFEAKIKSLKGDSTALNEIRQSFETLKKDYEDFSSGLSGNRLCDKVKSCSGGKPSGSKGSSASSGTGSTAK